MRRLYFPVNVDNANSHWTLVMADMDEKKLCYYDSMSKVNSVVHMQDKVLRKDGHDYEAARKYLSGALSIIVEEGKLRDVAVNSLEWTQVVVATPQQGTKTNGNAKSGVNCGVFLIWFADFLTDDLPFSFLNSDMPMFRRKVAAAILRGYLDYDRVPGEIEIVEDIEEEIEVVVPGEIEKVEEIEVVE